MLAECITAASSALAVGLFSADDLIDARLFFEITKNMSDLYFVWKSKLVVMVAVERCMKCDIALLSVYNRERLV